MESSAEAWRRRLADRLPGLETARDPRDALLDNVVGRPSPELAELLAAPSRRAAVLVGLVPRRDGPCLLLTERARHLVHHPGQISFPGGRLEPDETPLAAALREAEEEVALDAGQVEIVGELPPRLTGTGFAVTPVVGWIGAAFQARPDPAEVRSAFEAPVAHLLDPGNRRQDTRERFGTRFRTWEFFYREHRIWGATAAIVAELFEVIDAETI